MNSEFLLTWAGDTLFSVSLLIVLVMLARRPVARLFGPQIAYLLWLIPAARMVMPSITRTVEAPPEGVAETAYYIIQASDTVTTAATAPSTMAFYESPYFWPVLWIGGASIFLLVQLVSYAQRREELLADAVHIERVHEIDVIEVAGIDGPFAFGLLRRYIALPIGFRQSYNAAQREMILAHEIAHHRSGDLWANFAALLVLSLHWFNPLAWLAWRQFRFDQEAACDARVIRSRPLPEKQAYGAVIAQAATGRNLAFASPLNSKNSLKERLSIMAMKEKSKLRSTTGKFMVSGGLVIALGMTATISYAVQQAPEPPATPEPIASAEAPPAPPPPPALADAMTPEPPPPPIAPLEFEDATIDVSAETEGGKTAYVYKVTGEYTPGDEKTIVLRTDKKLSDAKLRAKIARVEASKVKADRIRIFADAQKSKRKIIKMQTKHESKWTKTKKDGDKKYERKIIISGSSGYDHEGTGIDHDAVVAMFPSISINEKCTEGADGSATAVTSNENGKQEVKVFICGEKNAKEARAQALEGLIEARSDLASEGEIPNDLRTKIIARLDSEIARLRARVE
ncbi:M56 family metallopeptidase [Sphingorhabdus sp. Alg239-R122]|uniref:M56 family metallopeptidase n=1 Tax=Sphingorhabdus sp. Alg239-R122 TaxID=2305989 RepID=UPI0013DC7EF8|nr:M56 family metallopeptidase [Sphingorhabdus sp. Alg239-R122]